MTVFIYDNGLNLNNYKNALERIGVDYVCSENVEKAESADALLLTGGGDVTPYFYGKIPDPLKKYDPMTDLAEFYLLKKFSLKRKTVVGICKGMQVINVFFGGTLKNTLTAHYAEGKDLYHGLRNSEESFLLPLGKILRVNSAHVQTLDKIPPSLSVCAYSSLGKVPEAVKHKTLRVFGVQFHPERMSEKFSDAFYGLFFKKTLVRPTD